MWIFLIGCDTNNACAESCWYNIRRTSKSCKSWHYKYGHVGGASVDLNGLVLIRSDNVHWE